MNFTHKGQKEKSLFRTRDGEVKPILNHVEGISFQENPLDIFILLARYKFAARLIDLDDSVLDAGCGLGLGSVMLSKFSRSVTGVDVDGELISYCRKAYGEHGNLNFEIGDLKDRSSMKGCFDSIVCMDVIEHFSKEDGAAVVESMANVLTKRGMLIIGTPNVRSQEFASARRKSTHLFEYDYAAFRELLSGHFPRVLIFSMTDELVSTGFSQLAWYFIGVCFK